MTTFSNIILTKIYNHGIKKKALPLLKHTFFQPSPEDTKRLISVFMSMQNRAVVGVVETAPRQVAVFFHFEDAVVSSSQRPRSDLGLVSLSHSR